MKHFSLACFIAFSIVSACSRHSGAPGKEATAKAILLVDSLSFSSVVAIECIKKGKDWVVSDEPAAAKYLIRHAKGVYKQGDIIAISELLLSFNTRYRKGILVGLGTKNGVQFQIGVEYNLLPGAVPKKRVVMGYPVVHTCISTDCKCCVLKVENGEMIGCSACQDCKTGAMTPCNHNISTTIREKE